jgi:hypothetical protein
VGESGKGNGKVKVGDNVLPINLLPYLAEAYTPPISADPSLSQFVQLVIKECTNSQSSY